MQSIAGSCVVMPSVLGGKIHQNFRDAFYLIKFPSGFDLKRLGYTNGRASQRKPLPDRVAEPARG